MSLSTQRARRKGHFADSKFLPSNLARRWIPLRSNFKRGTARAVQSLPSKTKTSTTYEAETATTVVSDPIDGAAPEPANAPTGVMTRIKQAEDMTAPTIKRTAAK